MGRLHSFLQVKRLRKNHMKSLHLTPIFEENNR